MNNYQKLEEIRARLPDGDDYGRRLCDELMAEGEKEVAGWAMPEREYRATSDWAVKRGWADRATDRQIRVYLDRAPKGSRPVIIKERREEEA